MLNKNKDSVPSVGPSIFKCKFCGKGGMVWKEVQKDIWRPYDIEQNKVHSCTVREDEEYLEYQRKNTGSITLESLVENLKLLGFECFVPRTSSWKFALIKSNNTQTVYFLINRLGVDFKLYDYVRDTNIDHNGKLYTDGGLAVRNYYLGSDINVHHLILRVANQLANDIPIGNMLLTGQGWSIHQQSATEKIKSESAQKYPEIAELYNTISTEDDSYSYDITKTAETLRASNQASVNESWMQEIWEWADRFEIDEGAIPHDSAVLLALENLSIFSVDFLPESIGNRAHPIFCVTAYNPLTGE
ncbi:hypothetical protein [Psychrobacter sp. BI730]|uniref:hypothetical protein n=1 Tax=Psychrobacter sp. BI730 TaxID=2705463 RepID=UPI0015CA4168|nr:hypothetical protein [Psychrobacter sp. BI730]NYR10119.1 hypothetical protein [Psychrobacter sp. BI730]